MRLIIILILLFHGIGQVMPFMAAWTKVPMGFSDRPWLLGSLQVGSGVGKVFGLLGLAAMVAFLYGTYGYWLQKPGFERWLMGAAGISLLVCLPWVRAWPVGSAVGNTVVNVLIIYYILRG